MTAELLAGTMLLAGVLYAITGGADYGGGVWDLLASGPRAADQRRRIENAIAPIWEVNHVWLILVVVILFSGFPRAFAVISTALHIPLTAMLLGVVARGAAFTFRAYDRPDDAVQRRWGLVFSIASVITPILLGVVVGSLSTGGVTLDAQGRVDSGFFTPWTTSPFPWCVGALTLTLFAYLAAVYLCVESEGELAEDFRRRALGASGVAALVAAVTFVVAGHEAEVVHAGLLGGPWAAGLMSVTALCALGAVAGLLRRRYALARALAAAQVGLIVLGWGAAQAPYLVVAGVTIEQASAPENVQTAMLVALGVGVPPLFGCLYWLLRVFKGRPGRG